MSRIIHIGIYYSKELWPVYHLSTIDGVALPETELNGATKPLKIYINCAIHFRYIQSCMSSSVHSCISCNYQVPFMFTSSKQVLSYTIEWCP